MLACSDGLFAQSGSRLLLPILARGVECVSDSSWELRRMADQVLPVTLRAIVSFEPSLLSQHVSLVASFAAFSALYF